MGEPGPADPCGPNYPNPVPDPLLAIKEDPTATLDPDPVPFDHSTEWDGTWLPFEDLED